MGGKRPLLYFIYFYIYIQHAKLQNILFYTAKTKYMNINYIHVCIYTAIKIVMQV